LSGFALYKVKNASKKLKNKKIEKLKLEFISGGKKEV
tara:strand:- start:1230 stop:1340 length:111 start_codon:yes stop_codon:yes gene_type:complete